MAVIEKHAAALNRAFGYPPERRQHVPTPGSDEAQRVTEKPTMYAAGHGRVFLNGKLFTVGARLVMDTPPAEPPAPVSVTITATALIADDGDDWFLPRVDDDDWLTDSPPCEPVAVKRVDLPLPPGAITDIDAARKACVPDRPAFGWPELFNAMPRGLRDSLQQQQADARRFALDQLQRIVNANTPKSPTAAVLLYAAKDGGIDYTHARVNAALWGDAFGPGLPLLYWPRCVLYAVALLGFGHRAHFHDATRQARRILNRRRRGVAVWATKPSPALAIYAARNRKESAR